MQTYYSVMRILAVSDTHGNDAKIPEVDVVLHGGDIYDKLEKGKASSCDPSSWTKAKKLCVVNGNHDCHDQHKIFAHHGITGRIEEIDPRLYVIGVGWSGEKYYELPTERELTKTCSSLMRQAVLRIPNGAYVIVLSHYPGIMPNLYNYNGNPEGWMFQCVTDLARATNAVMIVQGHVHELFRTAGYFRQGDYSSLVINPGPNGALVDFDANSDRPIRDVEWRRK